MYVHSSPKFLVKNISLYILHGSSPNSAHDVQLAASAHSFYVGCHMNSCTFLPEFKARILPPQSVDTQFMPWVPKQIDT